MLVVFQLDRSSDTILYKEPKIDYTALPVLISLKKFCHITGHVKT